MRRVTGSLLAALALGAVVATAITMGSAHADARSTKKTTLTVWVGWSARELRVFKGVVADYAKQHRDLNIKVGGSINDTKITNAVRSGNAPDVVSSFTSGMVGVFCGKGAWIDLKPFLSKDHVSLSQFPKTSLYYTQFKGKRCALPLLADSYGLYDSKGKAALASRFAWSKLLRWQKSLIDWYGYSNVVRFQAGLGDEFSASNAFEIG